MGISSEETDISDSDIEEYTEKFYKDFESEKLEVKVCNDALRCPFCPGKKKQQYPYEDLVQHANGQGKRGSNGSARKKANHRALARYLEADWTGVPLAAPPAISGSEQDLWIRAVKKREALTELEKEEKKNYPWHSSLEMAFEGQRKVGKNVSRLVEKQPRAKEEAPKKILDSMLSLSSANAGTS